MSKQSSPNPLVWAVDHLEEILGAAILFVQVTVAFLNVITRYVINYSLAWTEEFEVGLFVWLTLLGAAIAYKQHAHLSMVFVANALPQKWQKWIHVVGAVASVLLFVILFVFSVQQVIVEINYGAMTEALGIPQWWFTLGVPIGSLIVIARILQAARARFIRESAAVPIV
jgi:TRAP-type C4-dicarboxylate transport system permease small subunit